MAINTDDLDSAIASAAGETLVSHDRDKPNTVINIKSPPQVETSAALA